MEDRFMPNRKKMDMKEIHHVLKSGEIMLGNSGHDGEPMYLGRKIYNKIKCKVGADMNYIDRLEGVLMDTNYRTRLLNTSEEMALPAFTHSDIWKYRILRTVPQRQELVEPSLILDAPGMIDDFYLNVLDWSKENLLAVGLDKSVYIWNADTHNISLLLQTNSMSHHGVSHDAYVSSLKFLKSNPGGFMLSVGFSNGMVQVWDVFKNAMVLQLNGSESSGSNMGRGESAKNDCNVPNRISSLASLSSILSTGSKSGKITNYDIRALGNNKYSFISEHERHKQDVCGLEWSESGLLASGGNDNVVNILDVRNMENELHTFTKHKAAVKAIGWCPYKRNVLATGGGSVDRLVCIWDANKGKLVESVDTKSQVCCLRWSTETQELITGHGYANNEIVIWAYPHLLPTVRIKAHIRRVLHIALSPSGKTLVSTAGDENLKFWNILE